MVHKHQEVLRAEQVHPNNQKLPVELRIKLQQPIHQTDELHPELRICLFS